MQKVYTYQESLDSSLDYFNGDDLAAKVVTDKYLLKNGKGEYLEKTPEDMYWRIANEFARIEKNKFKNPLSAQEIFNLLDKFKYIIPQGSPLFGIGNNFQIISLSNCYVLDTPLDSYSSILKVDEQLVSISKRRGGTGVNLSNLRPEGTITNNAAQTSTGISTWMERYSNSIREVGQGGRRGALMIVLDIRHPDIEKFITIKHDRSKVTGANISVLLNQNFLDCVKENKPYTLQWPIDSASPKIKKEIKAKDLWDLIIKSARDNAEPGILMWDNVLKGPADCYERYRSTATNPCCHAASKPIFVKTRNGYKEIKTITSDDEIWITDAFTEKWASTSGYFNSGMADVYKVQFSNNDTFYVTLNHKFAVTGGYGKILDLVPLALLKEGDQILCDEGKVAVKIIKIEYNSTELVGCINVPDTGFFVTKTGIISGNSELPLPPLDSCRLICQNLYSYVDNPFTDKAKFNFGLFGQHVEIAQRLMDDLVDLESEKIEAIINKIKSDPEPDIIKRDELNLWGKVKKMNDEGRRTGLGITALGDCLAALGIKYGTPESISKTAKIYKQLKLSAYKSSVDMAEELGSFVGFDFDKEKDNEFLLRIKDEDDELYKRMKKFGRRNVAILTTAPTGSVSILTQTSSGIEPVFQLEYTRRKKINHNDPHSKIDFVDKSGDKWQEFTVYHPKVKTWMEITGETDTKKSPWFGCLANDIDWINRVKLQAEAQKHICHAISSTINLPNDVSEETVSKIYQTAFESGLKGLTIYRDGCRSGVLVNKEEKKDDFVKRPEDLNGELHHFTVDGHKYYTAVGLDNKGRPYEVFTGINDRKKDEIPKTIKTGIIHKISRGKYIFKSEDEEFHLNNGHNDSSADALSRLISCSLRHQVPLNFIIEQLLKTSGPMITFSKVLARTLKKYVPNNTKSTENCPECNNKLIFSEGCLKCSCGFSKCG